MVILSLNLRTEHGCPGWCALSEHETTKQIIFKTKTHEKIPAYLGNVGHENDLSKGFAVQRRALKKQPWCFGKVLYLAASGMMVQALDAREYHVPIELRQAMVCVALPGNGTGTLYSYIVVEPSMRFKWYPVFIDL